jgi:hypothetical protein
MQMNGRERTVPKVEYELDKTRLRHLIEESPPFLSPLRKRTHLLSETAVHER